ncbi:MAG: CoA-acylating methylmalonate-semialdehyde dehydrogenase [Gammaproteobacteria bacterium]|nr:CoA-acylating methylmalonate-semialdehyde dehydrogenase [Gammaproteobacteria bacterium]
MGDSATFIRVKNFINGEWVEENRGDYVPLFNPSTGEVIGEVPLSSRETTEAAVKSAHAAFDGWRKTPVATRVGYLFKLHQAMEVHFETLAQNIALDQAKHISEARGEVRRVIEIVEMSCTIPALIQGESLEGIAKGINGRVIKQPLGVFGGIAPFNFPALVFGWFVPFAIGAGNTFVFKPSMESPLFMQKMGDILNEIGLPGGVVNIVHGEREVAEAWYEMKEMTGVCLVGSSPTAKSIAEACGRVGKKTMLLGGAKNFLVAMEDAQIDLLIANCIQSGYGSAGQRCLASSIIAVVPEIYDEVVEKLADAAKQVTVGDALDPDVYMGPVISAAAKQRIENYIDGGVKAGARLILDGRNPDVPEANKNGYFVGPTIFADVTPCMDIAKDEIFGPVLSVMKIQDMDDALKLIRDQKVGNGACIFTQNLYYSETFITEADVGMVGVNVGICAPHPYMPFGGIKDSLVGNNKVQGKDGIDFFTQNKVATVRIAPPSGRCMVEKGDAAKTTKSSDKSAVRSCVAQ